MGATVILTLILSALGPPLAAESGNAAVDRAADEEEEDAPAIPVSQRV